MLSGTVMCPEHKKQWAEHTALGDAGDQNGGAERNVTNSLCTDCIVNSELKSLNSTCSHSCPLCP